MKRLVNFLLCFVCMIIFAACGSENDNDANIYSVYYISNSETRVEVHEYEMQSTTDEEQLQELITCLSTGPKKPTYKAPLAMGFEVKSVKNDEGKLLIDVDAAYTQMPATKEVLVRAALVRTLTQLPKVSYVGITVEGEHLYDNAGEAVGWMNADQFINNDGNEINTYELIKVKLYFANEDGDKLIAAYRQKHYSTNTPLERFVVEELIMGPSGKVEGLHPTIKPETKIISIMTKDGICYVNLDDSFLTVVNNVSTNVAVYSIVNSLVELPNINKVQILVNGEVPTTFATSTFERNLDYVTTLEQ